MFALVKWSLRQLHTTISHYNFLLQLSIGSGFIGWWCFDFL